jgi:DeoR/GlpR family transcriptional regulator of sugar metabolism
MFAAERRQLIVERVRANGVVSLAELARVAESSEATIRRDLRMLAEHGLVARSRGGAALPAGPAGEVVGGHQFGRTASNDDRSIAVLAASLIDEGDAVVLGAGRIGQEIARCLRDRRSLTVVTNSVLVCEELVHASAVEVVMTGGSLRGDTYALVGSEAENSLAGLRVRRAFLSGGGVSVARGLSTANMSAASVDRALASAADEVFVVADHTKVGLDAMFQTVAPERIAHLITDGHTDAGLLREFALAGVLTHVAPSPTRLNASAGR